jgi:hypothetical protein
MSRRRLFGTTVLQPGDAQAPGERPPRSISDDADAHQEVGRTFLVGADALRPIVDAVHDELDGTDAPPGFRPLDLGTVQRITWDIQAKRSTLGTGDGGSAGVDLAYRWDGSFLSGLGGIDTIWMSQGRPPPDRSTLIIITLVGYAYPVSGGQYRGRPSLEDTHRLALEDAAMLARWYADPTTGRVWRAGAPWPADQTEDPATAVALSARSRRAIAREVRHAIDNLPRAVVEDRPTLSFLPEDGRYLGVGGVSCDTPADHLVSCRIGPDSDPSDGSIDAWLDSVRILPSGRVVMVGA